jgi:hypothetical protein
LPGFAADPLLVRSGSGVVPSDAARWSQVGPIAARCLSFGQIPAMVASSLLVFTTGRLYCEHFVAATLKRD